MTRGATARRRRGLASWVRIIAPALLAIAAAAAPFPSAAAAAAPTGIHKIQHVVILMQENRTFDHYFGTFPGADGIPMSNGMPTVCVPDPASGQCVRPFHDSSLVNGGGPHDAGAAKADIDGGRMDGFIAERESAQNKCINPNDPSCSLSGNDVMGYHDAREIPNYWTYAHDFVLQDHMFESTASWSLPEHVFDVSGWTASCTNPGVASSCTNNLSNPGYPPDFPNPLSPHAAPHYAWTDLTYLLHAHSVSWGYYVFNGGEPDCQDPSLLVCGSVPQTSTTPGIWNPLPFFDDVAADQQLGNVQTVSNFRSAATAGRLPAVSWVIPNDDVSEHPSASIANGQAYVTDLINTIMRGPEWNSTAIFLSWDDWGGFYDHLTPVAVDRNGYGLRVPGLVISPYARQGYIDHQVLSHDAYLKFIENDFLGGQRLDPATDGRPDPRVGVRESQAQLGSLESEFDFNQTPRAPVLLPLNPPPGPAS